VSGVTSAPLTVVVASEAFAVNKADSQVWQQKYDYNGNPVGGFVLSQSGTVTNLAAGRDGSGQIELFALKSNGLVYRVNFDRAGNPTTGYVATTSSGTVTAVAATTTAAGNPEVFAIGSDMRIYAQTFDSTGTVSSGWFFPTGLQSSGQVIAIAATKDSSGNPEVMALGSDKHPYVINFNAAGTSTSASYVFPSGLASTTTGTQLSATQDSAGNPEMFLLGTDQKVYAVNFNGAGNVVTSNPPTGYFIPSGQQATAAALRVGAAKTLSGNAPQVWTVGTDNQVYTEPLNPTGTASTTGFVLTSSGMQFTALAVANDPPAGWRPESSMPPRADTTPLTATTHAARTVEPPSAGTLQIIMSATSAHPAVGNTSGLPLGADVLAIGRATAEPIAAFDRSADHHLLAVGLGIDNSGGPGSDRVLRLTDGRIATGERAQSGIAAMLSPSSQDVADEVVLDYLTLADLDGVFADAAMSVDPMDGDF
jgi:hypothetical protein